MTLKKTALANISANELVWMNFVYDVKIPDTMLRIDHKSMITDIKSCVIKARHY